MSTYPVPEIARALTLDWAEMLAQHFCADLKIFRSAPERYMLFSDQTVSIELMDGSTANFRWAFPLVDEKRKTIAIFTEHCGHHIFPIHEARVRVDDLLVFDHAAHR